ncbi:MAG: hypothetical protein B6D62_02220 [Candidatus Cloacimonas sp. 4484_275]|nr:MAG: hypothetical protein B6D62_02220 [Candidatus Cloacimonas sp. 4484_275]
MSYMNKWIHIDLSTGNFETGELDKKLLEKYIGAKGLGFALLDKIAPNPEPLSEENPLIFITGPFTGTKIQTSARTTLVTKSPLTNSIHDSHCGGNFGPAIKRAGYDYIVITGKSEKPVYLYISDEKVEILDAADLWGKGIFFTNDELINRHRGTNPRVKAFHDINLQFTKDILDNDGVKFRRVKGTMKCVRSGQEAGYLPTKNFLKGTFEEFENLTSETARRELNWEDTSCYNCAIRCSKWAKWDGHKIEGPEYETTAFLGSGCEISDIKDVALANELCNDLGFDTISTGVTCSFAMECYEKNLLDDWSGLEMKWGNAKAQREFIKMMANREGVGAIFADGTKLASEKIGDESKEFAINIFGMELSGVNPLGCLTMGVSLSVADFASHTRLWCTEAEMGPEFQIKDIPETVVNGQNEINTRNSLVICDFVPLGLDRMAPLLNAATGLNHTEESLREVGARITNLARRYNLRNGRKGDDDILPERFFKEKAVSGFMKGKVLDKTFFKDLIQKVYQVRGWNEKGEPTPETLKKYGIE